ncbi:MAG TPA: winged helix-turn-helix transcriptional regulator [Methanothermococcus okinawensis]|uniref:Winged helix-turn-helix transcriptional regulator n=1 Tax=Methanothermococcus okinawensis TaxID=155863 RepID=A0A832ZXQ2_9EURY|nr:winged helix-turn-helix transcriptional regulator [Methanothermococcus okinawensis]
MLRGKDATLAAIIETIIREEPETQEEIAKKLNISRRYVAKLLKPLIDEKIVLHPYVVDIDKLSKLEIYNIIEKPIFQIIDLLDKMGDKVLQNLDKVHKALKTGNVEDAKSVIFQDYTLNKLEEEVDITLKMDSLRYLPPRQRALLSKIASNIERCGDYLSNIAEEVIEGLYIKDYLQEDIEEIFSIIKRMFTIAMDVVKDKKVSFEIYDLEEELHRKLDKILKTLCEKEKCKATDINYYIQFGMFLKDVERFGDRCIKIFETAREFHYGVEGENSRDR